MVRCSTKEQTQDGKTSEDRQAAAIIEIAARHGLVVERVIHIIDVSGSDILNNEQAKEIFAAVESGEVSTLICDAMDRLFRPTEFASFAVLGPFQRSGSRIVTSTQVFDFSSPSSGILLPGIHALMAGQELHTLRLRVKSAKELKRRRSEIPSNEQTLPIGLGIDRATRKLVYTSEIAVVQRIFDLFDGERVHNYREIARATGISAVTVRNTLANSTYTGFRSYTQKSSNVKRVSARTGSVWKEKMDREPHEIIRVPTGLAPLVDEATFERRLRIMAEMRTNHLDRRTAAEHVHLGSGIVRCWCGDPMYFSASASRGIPRAYAACRRNSSPYKRKGGGCTQPHLKASDVDGAIWDIATNLLRNPNRMATMIRDAIQRTQGTIHPFPLDQDAELKKLRAQRQRLLDGYQEGLIEIDELKERRRKIETRIGQIEAYSTPPTVSVDVEGLVRRIAEGVILLPKVRSVLERKKLVHALLAEVRVENRHIVGLRLHPDLAVQGSEYLTLDVPVRVAPEPPPENHKTCTTCKTLLPLDAFYRGKGQCKTCFGGKVRARRLARLSNS